MKLVKAIIVSGKWVKANIKDYIAADIAIYRKAYPQYVFRYYPEYSLKPGPQFIGDYKNSKINDTNSWRHNEGSFSDMLIPEEWLKEDDWLPCYEDEIKEI